MFSPEHNILESVVWKSLFFEKNTLYFTQFLTTGFRGDAQRIGHSQLESEEVSKANP